MTDTEKVFIGSVKVHKFADGGSVLNVGMEQKDIDLLIKHRDGRGWSNFSIKKSLKSTPDDPKYYGEIYVPKTEEPSPQATPPTEDLPF